MSRIAPESTDEVLQSGWEAVAIVRLCEVVTGDRDAPLSPTIAGDISMALGLAGRLMSAVQNRLDLNADAIEDARTRRLKRGG